jgi:tetratricopeptide (TPR) repeat protein
MQQKLTLAFACACALVVSLGAASTLRAESTPEPTTTESDTGPPQFEQRELQRQIDKAEEYVNKLAERDADQAKGLLYKMHLVLAKGDTQSAIGIGRQLTTDYKEFSESWEALGEALQSAGQIDAAIGNYQTALDKQGTNVKAMRNLITCYYRLNKLDEAKNAIADARPASARRPL